MKITDFVRYAAPISKLMGGQPVLDVIAPELIRAAQSKINQNPNIPFNLKEDGILGDKTKMALKSIKTDRAAILEALDQMQKAIDTIKEEIE